MKHYDIIIVGGGMVGSCAALMLASKGHKVCLIEPYPLSMPETKHQEDFRGLALSSLTVDILEKFSIWKYLSKAATSINAVHVSEQGKFGTFCWRKEELGLDSLGAVIEGGNLSWTLQDLVRDSNNIDCIWNNSVEDYKYSDSLGSWILDISEEKISTQLLIGADGVDSNLRKLIDIPLSEEDLGQIAIVSNVELTSAHRQLAYERFCPLGSLALVPYQGRFMKSILIVSVDKSAEYLNMNDLAYRKTLKGIMSNHIPEISFVGRRASYPLIQRSINTLAKNQVVLLGNSAFTMHPIAAQGFNLAVRDIASLVELLERDKVSISDSLEEYCRWRSKEHDNIRNCTKYIVNTFSGGSVLKKIARRGAMSFLGISPYARSMVMNYMLGKYERLPEVAMESI